MTILLYCIIIYNIYSNIIGWMALKLHVLYKELATNAITRSYVFGFLKNEPRN